MNLDHVFKKTLVRPFAGIRKKPEVPEGLLCKCSMCKKAIVAEDVRKNFYVCPSCNGYFRVRAQERIARIADEGSFLEWDQDLVGKNPMEFEGYEEKIAAARLKTRLKEAVVTGQCTIGGEPCALRDGWPLYDGKHGRGSRRKNYACSRRGNKKEAAYYHFYMLWRCKNAGGNYISYADGKDISCA